MVSRDVARAVRRHADQNSDRLADIPSVRALFGTVETVNPAATVDVLWRGSRLNARHGASYTPQVGDRVLCLLVDDQLWVIDKSA